MKNPKIRFKGYTDDWEQRKLSDEFKNFIVPMRDKPKEFGGNIPWTRIEDIEGKYLNDSLSGQYVTEETINQMNLKIIPKDSLIVSSSATFGVVAVITQDLITNQTFIGLVPNDKETLDYWYAFFHSDEARKYMRLQSAGSTIFYIARESFENMPIKVPTKDEMIKIGTYFDNLDNLITLHQRKCEETKKLKKYMLQKMFPQNGTNVPEIRFDGFTDAWEQRKFSEIATRESKCDISSRDIPCVEYEDVVANEGQLNKDISLKEVQKKGIVFDGSQILYGKLRPYLHNWLNPEFMGVAVGDWWVLKPIDADKNFLYRLIQTQQFDDVANLSVGSKMPRADWSLVSETEFYIPNMIEEQAKISGYFSNLDNLITLHQKKCDELTKIKKFMLQNMFV